MPGRRLRKVVCADDSAASDAAAVMVIFSVHVGGLELVEGEPGAGCASAMAAPRSCLGGLTRDFWRFAVPGVVGRFFRAKALRFGANGDDARGCRNPLGGRRCGYPLRARAPGENP